jgi:hypothetical protein
MTIRSLRGLAFGAAVAIAFVAVAVAPACAQSTDARVAEAGPGVGESVPRLVQFNGTLKDAAARPLSGAASVTFAIYAEQDGGPALWTETQNVLADSNGHYTALLGTSTSGGFPAELIGTGQSRWLGVTIARQPEMPRVLLASVPYALKAGDADTLGGLPASSYVTTQQLAARTTAPVFSGGSTIIATPGVATMQASQSAVSTDAAQSSVIQANPTGSGTTDYIPLWTSGSNLGNSLLFQTGGKLGVGTTTPASTLDINGGQILRGGFYEYPQGTATASAGQPSHSFQWDASVFNSSTKAPVSYGFGFRAIPESNNTGYPSAALDLFFGTGGPDGSLTDTGLSINNVGAINFVPGQQFNGASESVGYINLPASSGAFQGVIVLGGSPFLSAYGSDTNTFVGGRAGGGPSTTGTQNTATGYEALGSNTGGFSDSAFGYQALLSNTGGTGNVAQGFWALQRNATGSANTAVGFEALQTNNGNSNTAVGDAAGVTNVSGGQITVIGAGADVAVDGLQNATAIGAGAVVGASKSIVLGGTGSSVVNVGIGTSTPAYTLDVKDSNLGGGAISGSTTVAGHAAVSGANFATSGVATGGYFLSESSSGVGVVGANTAGGYAAQFQGNVQVTGTLTKGGGSFEIDDPIDPANKYLSHSFVESPDMMNIYNGIVTLDAHGSAVVTMPEWFSALNRDFRYQLTAIGSGAPKLHIAEEMHGNQFRIGGGKKGMRVSWEVTGIRQDAWANAHRVPNEETKPTNQQGKYLHPELFGAGPDKAIGAGAAINAKSPASVAPAAAGEATSANANAIPGGH